MNREDAVVHKVVVLYRKCTGLNSNQSKLRFELFKFFYKNSKFTFFVRIKWDIFASFLNQ